MSETHFPARYRALGAMMERLGAQIPATMGGFGQLHEAAVSEGALSTKTKELIAPAIGVAVRCDGCIGFHAEELVRLGASREEIAEMLGMAIYMGGGPSLMYAADAMKAFDQYSQSA